MTKVPFGRHSFDLPPSKGVDTSCTGTILSLWFPPLDQDTPPLITFTAFCTIDPHFPLCLAIGSYSLLRHMYFYYNTSLAISTLSFFCVKLCEVNFSISTAV